MLLSAPNQFTGIVVAVKEGAVNGVVTIDLGASLIKAGITMESIRELGLVEGCRATAVVKASDVLLATGTERLRVSARDQFAGTVTRVERGAVNGIVELTTPDDLRICGSITNEAIDDLGLEPGVAALAIVKATDVMVASDTDERA